MADETVHLYPLGDRVTEDRSLPSDEKAEECQCGANGGEGCWCCTDDCPEDCMADHRGEQ